MPYKRIVMAREVTTTGSKKVKTLYKEFNEHFPYLRLKLLSSIEYSKSLSGETITGVSIEHTLNDVREKKGKGVISFSGRKKVKTVEEEFKEVFGLYCQICYTSADGKRYYTSKAEDSKTLTQLNREKMEASCLKGEWS